MTRFLRGIITLMRRKGSKNKSPKLTTVPQDVVKPLDPSLITMDHPVIGEGVEIVSVIKPRKDPQELLNNFLKENNLQVDFDVIREGTPVTTEYGIIKLEQDTLVLKATYVQR